jgi:cytochrome P450
MCIGAGFAIYEICLAISHIVKNYNIISVKNSVDFNPLITLKPVDVKVVFSNRK